MYKCEVCEKKFYKPEKIKEEEKQYYECLNDYLEYCCPYCKSAISIDED